MAVDDDQRLVRSRDRARAADADRSRGRRVARRGHDVGPGYTALQRLVHRDHRNVLDVAHPDVGHRTREVGLLHFAVTDHDHLVDVLVVGRQRHVDLRAVADADFLGHVAQVGEVEDRLGRLHPEGVGAFGVGRGSARRTREHDRHAGQRSAGVAVRDEALHHARFAGCGFQRDVDLRPALGRDLPGQIAPAGEFEHGRGRGCPDGVGALRVGRGCRRRAGEPDAHTGQRPAAVAVGHGSPHLGGRLGRERRDGNRYQHEQRADHFAEFSHIGSV